MQSHLQRVKQAYFCRQSYRPPPIASQPMLLEEQRQRQGRSVSDASSASGHPRSFQEGNARYGRRPSSVQRPPSLYRPASVQPPLYQEDSHRSHASHGGYGRSPSTVSRHRSRDGRASPRSPQKAYLGEKNEGYVSPTPMRYAGAKRKIKPAAATAGGAVIGATGVAGAAHVATHDDSCCGFGDCFGCGDDGGCDGCGEFCECLEMCS